MSADTWRVEARFPPTSYWAMQVDRLGRQAASETAEWYAGRYPEWALRLVDDSTGETVHLGRDGKPALTEAEWDSAIAEEASRWFDGVWEQSAGGGQTFVIDLRTESERMADIAADRYEASLERGRDL